MLIAKKICEHFLGYFFPNDFILLSFTIAQFGCVLMSWKNILKSEQDVEKLFGRGKPFDMQARRDSAEEIERILSDAQKDAFLKNPKMIKIISKELRQQMKVDPKRDNYEVRINQLPLSDKMRKAYVAFMQDESYRKIYLDKLRDMFGAEVTTTDGFETITFTLMPANRNNPNYNY